MVHAPKPKAKDSGVKQSAEPTTKKNINKISDNPINAIQNAIGNRGLANILQQRKKQKEAQKEKTAKPEEKKQDDKKSKKETKDNTEKIRENKEKELSITKTDSKKEKKSKKERKSVKQEIKPVKAPSEKTQQPASSMGPAESKKEITGSSSEETIKNFTNLSATGVAQNFASLGASVSEKFQADRKTIQENTPKIQAKSKKQAKIASKRAPIQEGSVKPPQIDQNAAQVSVPSAGQGPKIELTGEADPSQSAAELGQASQTAQAKQEEESQKILANDSENKIKPLSMETEAEAQISQASSKTATAQDEKMAQYTALQMDANTRSLADADMGKQLSGTLAESQAKVKNASKKRDKDRELAEQETQSKAEELSSNASMEQQQAIEDSKSQIQQHKEKGLQESKKKLGEFNKNSSQQHQDTLQKVNTKVKTEQQKADKAIDEGHKKATQKQNQAKRDAAQKEKEIRAKNKKRGFWDKVGDFFKGLAKAISSAVTKIFDAVKSVVNGILNAAKKLATGIIDLARKAVVGLLKAYATVLKGMVNVLLASFPALRKKINAAIDGVVNLAVTIVNKVADKLKSAVTALIDKFQKAVNFFINAYESLVTGAIQMMGALLSGDFTGALKIAFLSACKAAGLPGEELLGTLSRAGNLLVNIIKNPAPFVKNLIGAAIKGFSQFTANFGKHLKAGLMGWLFGQVAETGIKLPSSFSAAGVFDVIRQVLGLTYEYVRSRAVAKIGEENVERIEKVASYLKILFTGGPEKLWEKIKGDLSNLKEKVMSGIVDFIVQKIVQSAVVKISSMLIPGAGFLQAIISTYNTIQFFVDKIKQIMAVVNSVLDSISKIAKGDIGAAANYIEATLAKTLPLVISFMAKLIGIGGIGQKIKAIIDKLRTPVNKAVDFVIDKAIALFKSAVAGVKKLGKKVMSKIKGALFPKTAFKIGNEGHKMWTEKKGSKVQVMIASEAQELRAFLNHMVNDESKKKPIEAQIVLLEQNDNKNVVIAGEISKITDANLKAQKQKELDKNKEESIKIGAKIIDMLRTSVDSSKVPGKYLEIEGHFAPYTKQISATGDDVTPDHQPSAALVSAAAVLVPNSTFAKQWNSGEHASGAWTVNLYKKRHSPTRTYGTSTVAAHLKKGVLDIADEGGRKEQVRENLALYLHEQAKGDAAWIESSVLSKSETDNVWKDVDSKANVEKQKTRIRKGESKVKSSSYKSMIRKAVSDGDVKTTLTKSEKEQILPKKQALKLKSKPKTGSKTGMVLEEFRDYKTIHAERVREKSAEDLQKRPAKRKKTSTIDTDEEMED